MADCQQPDSEMCVLVIPHICARYAQNLHLHTHERPLTVTRSYSNIYFMPSQNTRVNLTLPDDVISVLDRISEISGVGRATFVREILIDSLPMLNDMAKALEMASQKNLDAFKVISNAVRDATQKADQLRLDIDKTRRRAARRKKLD